MIVETIKMDLLDSDSKIMEQSAKEKKPKTRRKAGLAGLNRFKGLTEAYRNTNDTATVTTETASKAEPDNTSIKIDQKILEHIQKKSNANNKIITPDAEATDIPNNNQNATLESNKPDSEAQNTPQITSDNNLDNIEVTPDNIFDNNEITSDNKIHHVQVTPDNNQDNSIDNKLIPDNKHQENTLNAPLYDYRTLMGNEKNLLGILFHECLREGALITNKIPMSALASKLNTSIGTAKMTTHRLKKKGLIESVEAQRTKNGWTRYGISKELYQMLQKDTAFFNSESTRITKQITKEVTRPSSSSSNNFLNKTTTTSRLPEGWEIIQIPETLKEIGISIAHIIQIAGDGFLGPDELQESLDAFSYDLSNGAVNARLGPLRLLLGVLRKQKVPYISQALIEQERKQLEEYMKVKEEAEALKQKQAEFGLIQSFEKWWSGLSADEKNRFAPPNNFYEAGSEMQKRIARGKFIENPEDSLTSS
jgi:predicted transcriptional regulator